MQNVHVDLGGAGYDILIGDGLLDRAADYLEPLAREGRLLVVTDENVWNIAGARFATALGNIKVTPILVAAGEQSKSWVGLQSVVERLLAERIERTDHVIAFGGGVIGDLAGFAASIVKRGCSFVQVPTTLLAQVDSSVGGKTGIDVSAGKNLVGAFHQPSLVLIDPTLLDTLPEREIRAGYAEIVKYALIESASFFAWLEEHGPDVITGESISRARAIITAVSGKARIVEQDERERSGRRALLNLGHTFGHALEAEAGYSSRLLHGEAVALGCTLAFDYSSRRRICTNEDAARVRCHFSRLRLPTTLAEVGLEARGSDLVRHMEFDKKREQGRTAFILARGIGRAYVDTEVDLADIAAFLDEQP
ncbi:MAG TPA: 3-dehydroquinate synthase [Sphingomicrobium sp.]|nr:3-dehydroquinate synthase [Sphingomicrobium sp.]